MLIEECGVVGGCSATGNRDSGCGMHDVMGDGWNLPTYLQYNTIHRMDVKKPFNYPDRDSYRRDKISGWERMDLWDQIFLIAVR